MALDLEKLSVGEIRKLLSSNNVDTRGCVEKSDLIKKAKEHKLHLKTPQPAASHRPAPAAGPSTSGSRAESSGAASARAAGGAGTRDAAGRSPTDGTPKERELVKKILHTKDFYEVLGVARNATDDEVKKGYRKLALQLHPDKNRAAGAEEAFKVASKAFDTLSDPQKRAAYDQYGEAAVNGAAGAGGNPFAGFGGGMPGFHAGNAADLDELLRNLFGGGMGGMGGGGFGAGPGFGAAGFGPGFGQGFGGAGFGAPPPRRQAGQQQGFARGARGANPNPGGFGFNLGGLSPGVLLPLLPVGLMVFSQLLSLIPFLIKNIHMLFLLFIVPAEWRRTIVIVMLVMMVMGRMGPF